MAFKKDDNSIQQLPRSRRAFSEAILMKHLNEGGEDSLYLLRNVFKNEEEETEARLKAAIAFAKLVFVQSDGGEDNEQNQSIMANAARFASRLIKAGVPLNIVQLIFSAAEEEEAEAQKEALESEQNTDAE